MSEQFVLLQTLSSPLPGSVVGTTTLGDGFGSAVSIDGDQLVVSAQNATVDSISNTGALLFYTQKHNQFSQSQPPFSELLTSDVPGAFNALKIQGCLAMGGFGAKVSGGPGPAAHPGGCVLVFKLEGNQWNLVQTLLPSDPPTYVYNNFTYGIEFGGQYLDFDGDWAFIGAPQNQIDGVPLAGNVSVFHLENEKWQLTQKITSPTGPIFNQSIGGASYINGNYAFITAEGNYTQFGSNPPDNGYAYFYQLNQHTNQWEFVELLRGNSPLPPSPNGIGDLFGFRIEFNNNWAVIGAPLDNTNPQGVFIAGAVYIYSAYNNKGVTNWQFVTKLYPQNPAVQGAFGTNLVLYEDYIFITNNNSSSDGTMKHVGSVEVYKLCNGQWTYLTTILNPNPHQLDFFGGDLSASQNRLVIGENPNFSYYLPYTDVPVPTTFNNGNTYVYKY